MAVNNLNFAATVDAWVKKTERRMAAVFKQSTQKLFSNITAELSGSMVKVQTGFLRASVQGSLSAMPPINHGARPTAGRSYAPQFGQITATIAGAELGQTIYIGWTAAYAGLVHDGTSRMGPRPFVALPAMSWKSIVSATVAEAKQRVGR